MLNCNSLDKYQVEAVKTDLRNVLVVAAPGSGKTTTIINRIIFLIKEKNVCASNIIVITFTKAAAENMKRRFTRATNGEIRPPFFGTFHGLFYKILKRYINFQIVESMISYRIIKNQLVSYFDEVSDEKIKEILNCISIFKTSDIELESFNPEIDKEIFISCYNAYEEFKKEHNLFDFDDLQIKCKELFIKHPEILNGYRSMFKYILVDEFQDSDMMQINILKLLNKNNSIFAVGDEDQCIYGFRGSRPDCMVDFEEHFVDGKKIYLSNNYRCPLNIVNASINLIKYNSMRNNKEITAVKNVVNPIKVVNSINEGIQAREIIKVINDNRNNYGFKFSDFAILYRTNLESRSLIDQFIKNKIPFRLMDKEYNFFEHFICKDIISYLKLSIDESDKESFLRIINRPFRYFGKTMLNKLKNDVVKKSCFEALKENEELHPYQMLNIDKIRKDIINLNKMSLSSAIEHILSDLGYYDYVREYAIKYKLNLQDLIDIIDEFKSSAQDYKTIITFLAHIEEYSNEIENSKKSTIFMDAVILSTIHGVKGMEYKNVFIINCNEDYLPHSSSVDTNLEEERRLFYVGITRAEVNLCLCISQNIKGTKRETSRFIKELGLNLKAMDKQFLKLNDKLSHKSFGEGNVTSLDDDIVEVQFPDGLKRRFDISVSFNNDLLRKL